MSVIVTDTGFGPESWEGGFGRGVADALDIGPDADLAWVVGKLPTLRMIRVDFPDFTDGRGFSIARRLRQSGYVGRLRARGHVLADQYAMARRAGFDEVEIDDDLAARQPQDQWLARSDWRAHDYQARLRGKVGGPQACDCWYTNERN